METGRRKKNGSMDKTVKNYIIRCGAAEAYLTRIETSKKEPPVYVYGTKDKKKAKRFTEEEAREIAEKQRAVAVRMKD